MRLCARAAFWHAMAVARPTVLATGAGQSVLNTATDSFRTELSGIGAQAATADEAQTVLASVGQSLAKLIDEQATKLDPKTGTHLSQFAAHVRRNFGAGTSRTKREKRIPGVSPGALSRAA